MDQLNPASLDWALTHILRFGDTDIFPVPFEFEAISHSWLSIRPALERLDLCEYVPSVGQRILVPKPGGGFRVTVQLDPIDSILYTALAFEAAESIEQSRVDRSQQVACSYRINLDANLPAWRAFCAGKGLAGYWFHHVSITFYSALFWFWSWVGWRVDVKPRLRNRNALAAV